MECPFCRTTSEETIYIAIYEVSWFPQLWKGQRPLMRPSGQKFGCIIQKRLNKNTLWQKSSEISPNVGTESKKIIYFLQWKHLQ
jgi:hypothetical protein